MIVVRDRRPSLFVAALITYFLPTLVSSDQSLRASLLQPALLNAPLGESDFYTYDKSALPASSSGQPKGVTVELSLHLFPAAVASHAANVARQTIGFTGWLRLRWVDSRLRWGSAVSAEDSVVLAGDTQLDETDVFAPDIGLQNAVTEHTKLGAGSYLTSSQVGTVEWVQPQTLLPVCQFELASFPFDTVVCNLTFASWTMSSGYMVLGHLGNAVNVAESSNSTAEFKIIDTSWHKVTIPELLLNTQKGSRDALVITVHLERGTWRYYWFRLMLPQILLTILSFGVFWCNGASRERLGFGAAVLLLNAILQLCSDSNIPLSSGTVLTDLMDINLIFCTAALLESVLVVMLFYKRDEYLAPVWLQHCGSLLLLKIGISTSYGASTHIGTVESNQHLNEYLKNNVVTNSPHHKKPQTLRSMSDVMISGGNLEYHNYDPNKKQRPKEKHKMMKILGIAPVDTSGRDPALFGKIYIRGGKSVATPDQNESLSSWIGRIGYSDYIESGFIVKGFKEKLGITTLKKLAECEMTEADLAKDLGIMELLPRRRLLHHIRALDAKEEEEDPLDSALQMIQDGLISNASAPPGFSETGGAFTNSPENKPKSFPKWDSVGLKLTLEEQVFHTYWLVFSKRVDLVAQFVMPVAYGAMVYVLMSPYLDMILDSKQARETQ